MRAVVWTVCSAYGKFQDQFSILLPFETLDIFKNIGSDCSFDKHPALEMKILGYPGPMRIRVGIDLPHSLVCHKR
jgi:hypothetical protein